REFNNPSWDFLIMVRDVDVENRTMFDAIFKHRGRKGAGEETFDLVVQAGKAVVNFDMDRGEARVFLVNSEISGGGKKANVLGSDGRYIVMPLPDKNNKGFEKRIQEWTTAEMVAEQADFRKKIARERKRQAVAAALWIGSGRLDRVDWFHVQEAFIDY